MEDLRQAGLEPYAYRFDRTHYTSELQEQYKSLADGAEDEAGARVAVSGRVMAKRVMGKLAFLSLRDDRAQIQVRNRSRCGTAGSKSAIHRQPMYLIPDDPFSPPLHRQTASWFPNSCTWTVRA